jgi:hypothetical protein
LPLGRPRRLPLGFTGVLDGRVGLPVRLAEAEPFIDTLVIF